MKKHYKSMLVLMVFLIMLVVTSGLGVTYAYYQKEVTGAVSARTSAYDGEIYIESETHQIIPDEDTAVDTVTFYVKNYTGTDANPVNSELNLSYIINLNLTNWFGACSNPVSYRLYSVDVNNSEAELTLTNAQTSTIDFSLITTQKHKYRLKLYWDLSNNGSTCYANKSGDVGISADIFQTRRAG